MSIKSAKKKETEYRQLSNIINALNYIWHNPAKSLNLEDLSKECGVSKYHFHRLFREYQGETLNEHVTRKRLEFAANQLVMMKNSNVSLLAENLGFSSSANFSKAFKNYFGVTPREWRDPERINCVNEGVLKSKHGKQINPKFHYANFESTNLNEKKRRIETLNNVISFVKIKEQTLYYRSVVNGMDFEVLNPLWEEVIKWAASNVEDWETKLFGIWYDNWYVCPEKLMRHDAAILVPDTTPMPPSFMRQQLDTGIYATGIIQGSHEELCDLALDIYMLWFPNKRIVPDLKPYYINYLNDVEKDGFYRIRFYIKVHSSVSERKLNLTQSSELDE